MGSLLSVVDRNRDNSIQANRASCSQIHRIVSPKERKLESKFMVQTSQIELTRDQMVVLI